jgi:hypothetical protein
MRPMTTTTATRRSWGHRLPRNKHVRLYVRTPAVRQVQLLEARGQVGQAALRHAQAATKGEAPQPRQPTQRHQACGVCPCSKRGA